MSQGGLLNISADGANYTAEGDFEYNLGLPVKEAVLDSAGKVIDYIEKAQVNFIKGKIYVTKKDSIVDILGKKGFTAILELPNGKSIVLSKAWNQSDGTVSTEKNTMELHLVGLKAQEIK
jgi:hypothetical protein